MDEGEPMSRSLSYHLPPPHRLGSSLRLHHVCSTTALATPTLSTPSSESILQQLSTSFWIRSSDTEREGIDEPDVGREVGRKVPPSAHARSHGVPRAKAPRLEPVVQHSGGPLTEFALFLPPKIPAAILQSRSALTDFVSSTTTTYLGLWEFSTELKLLDLRFSPPYDEYLAEDVDYLSQFLTLVTEKLSNVKSIVNLYLPQVFLRVHKSNSPWSQAKLEELLRPVATSRIAIAHTFLPLKSSLQKSDIAELNLKPLASFLHRSPTIKELTVVSSAPEIQEFHRQLDVELKKVRKGLKTASVKVNHSSRDIGAPGPAYIVDLDVQHPVGEVIDPDKLVSSLNTDVGRMKENGQVERGTRSSSRRTKEKPRSALSTDCTYAEEAELSTDGPFVSEVWKLDRLHDDGIDGSGTTIAVIDSGINYTHAAFKGRVTAIRNFVSEEIGNIDCAIDSDGHGTLCAGIAASSTFYCPIKPGDPASPCVQVPPGVAPGASLVVCKVVKTSDGDVDSRAFLAALQWLKELHVSGTRIDVVSISLASTYHSSERAAVISELTKLGVIVVCCASNVGRLRLQPIAFPARLGHVLCIGAQDENGKPTSFSPVGRELDFLAPGENIWGPGPGTVSPLAMDCGSGTSCATPAVAGLVCLILQAIQQISDSDPEKYQIGATRLIDVVRNVWVMRELLKEMSSSPGHHSDEIGYGTLDPYRVLDRSPDEIRRLIDQMVEDE